jgi:hypothetical protein
MIVQMLDVALGAALIGGGLGAVSALVDADIGHAPVAWRRFLWREAAFAGVTLAAGIRLVCFGALG